MLHTSQQINKFWNRNKPFAAALVISGVVLALYAWFRPQSPGWSIGMLALVAGIMSVRPKMRIVEKLGWVAVLIALAVLEVQAINRNDAANIVARDQQNDRFNSIVTGLTTATAASKQQYINTVSHVDDVLNTTQKVASLSKDNLDAVTGGDSFFYFRYFTDDMGGVITQGRNSIRSASLTYMDVYDFNNLAKEIRSKEINSVSDFLPKENSISTSVNLGDLAPRIAQPFKAKTMKAHNGEVRYNISLSALNGRFNEIYLRRPARSGRWVEAIRVVRSDGPRKGSVVFQQVAPDFPLGPDGKVPWNFPG